MTFLDSKASFAWWVNLYHHADMVIFSSELAREAKRTRERRFRQEAVRSPAPKDLGLTIGLASVVIL